MYYWTFLLSCYRSSIWTCKILRTIRILFIRPAWRSPFSLAVFKWNLIVDELFIYFLLSIEIKCFISFFSIFATFVLFNSICFKFFILCLPFVFFIFSILFLPVCIVTLVYAERNWRNKFNHTSFMWITNWWSSFIFQLSSFCWFIFVD